MKLTQPWRKGCYRRFVPNLTFHVALLAGLFLSLISAQAQSEYTPTGSGADLSQASNWSPAETPGPEDAANWSSYNTGLINSFTTDNTTWGQISVTNWDSTVSLNYGWQ